MIPENYKFNQRLLTLFNTPHPSIGYIPSASHPEGRFYQDRKTYYAALGGDLVVSCELDSNYQPESFARMLQCDGIHLSGGNTFHFLYWLKRRELLEDLRRFVTRGGVFIGTALAPS